MRLIDADALFPYGAVPFIENDGFTTADKLYGIIKNAPTIDPETLRPTGRWVNGRILVGGFAEILGFDCSVCGKTVKDHKYKYCPNCGAKMEG